MTTHHLRRFTSAFGRILFLAGLFLILFLGTAFLIAQVLSLFRGTLFYEKGNLYFSLVCSLIAWLFIAAFHLRKEAVRLSFLDRDIFLKRLKSLADELGYEMVSQSEKHLKFLPRFGSFLLGGGIQVAVESHGVDLSGPKVYLELLRRRLRFGNHLDNVHQAFQGNRHRHGEPLLRRVHLHLRFPSAKLPEIVQHVVQPLDQQAEVVCELHIQAQSPEGIRDNTVENQVRPWLVEQGILLEVHKEPAQREENRKAVAPIPVAGQLPA